MAAGHVPLTAVWWPDRFPDAETPHCATLQKCCTSWCNLEEKFQFCWFCQFEMLQAVINFILQFPTWASAFEFNIPTVTLTPKSHQTPKQWTSVMVYLVYLYVWVIIFFLIKNTFFFLYLFVSINFSLDYIKLILLNVIKTFNWMINSA